MFIAAYLKVSQRTIRYMAWRFKFIQISLQIPPLSVPICQRMFDLSRLYRWTGLVSLESRGALPEAHPACPQPRGGNTAAPVPPAQTTPSGPSGPTGPAPPPVSEYLVQLSALQPSASSLYAYWADFSEDIFSDAQFTSSLLGSLLYINPFKR